VTQRLPVGTEAAPEWGFLMCLPVYRKNLPVDTLARRRANLEGWIVASFRIGDLMSTLYGEGTPGLNVKIYDGVDVSDASRLYATGLIAANHAAFEAQEYVGFAGHSWTLVVRSTPEFERRFSNDSAQIIAISGVGLSLVLALLTWQFLTGRERAHATAQEMTRQLRERSEQYRRIVETADEGIWMVDAQGLTSFVNPKMQQMLGYSADELAGRAWTDFTDDAGGRALEGFVTDSSRNSRSQALEICFRRKDSTELVGSLSVSPILSESGGLTGCLAMVTDVTRHKQAEANRAHLETQLRQSQKMEAIGTLAGGVAHDFNNILASILGNAALLQQDLGAEHPAAGRLEQICLAGKRGRSLVQQIGAFSRREPQERIRQPLRPLLDEAVKLLRSTLPAQVEIDLRLSDAPLEISADATQLQQVLINLCTNAWHAMTDGKGCIVIALDSIRLDGAMAERLGRLAPGRYAHLRVADDGCGMTEAVRLRIFEPFFTTKAIGKGTGLGLSVVHGIIASHSGAITVETVPGRGSSFDMYFPLTAATVSSALEQTASVASVAASVRGSGQHVLYVDDDQVMVVMVEALLHRAGYRVTSLSDPRQALARACQVEDPIDLLVTDFNMPDLSGVDLARELGRKRPTIPIVITSGNITDTLRSDARQAGVRYLLQKEFTLERLSLLVHGVFEDADGLASASTDRMRSELT
ncbi:MAG: ATP-binding protein, partial [Ideonella sp.]